MDGPQSASALLIEFLKNQTPVIVDHALIEVTYFQLIRVVQARQNRHVCLASKLNPLLPSWTNRQKATARIAVFRHRPIRIDDWVANPRKQPEIFLLPTSAHRLTQLR